MIAKRPRKQSDSNKVGYEVTWKKLYNTFLDNTMMAKPCINAAKQASWHIWPIFPRPSSGNFEISSTRYYVL